MLRHVVLLRISPARRAEDIQNIFAALKRLQNTIPGIVHISAGSDNSPEGLQRGFTHGFTVDFENASARDAYLPHPEHQKVGAMIVAAAEGGVDGILVLDWEMG